MSDIGDAIQSLYNKFIMRDVLSFVIPGAVVVGSLLDLSQMSHILKLFHSNSIPFILYFPIFGIFYMVGFAVQCLGAEILHVIKFHRMTWEEHFRRLARLPQNDREAMSQHERFVVLKQMCGNGALSMFIAGVLLAIKLWIPCLFPVALFIIVVLLIISLYMGHRAHVERQELWEDVILER